MTYAVWFGKPETGIPIPVEQTSPVMKMSRFAWLPGRLLPTAWAMGTRSTLAIVWLMNVETTYRQHVGGKDKEGDGCGHDLRVQRL